MMSARKVIIMVGGLLIAAMVQYYFGDTSLSGSGFGETKTKGAVSDLSRKKLGGLNEGSQGEVPLNEREKSRGTSGANEITTQNTVQNVTQNTSDPTGSTGPSLNGQGADVKANEGSEGASAARNIQSVESLELGLQQMQELWSRYRECQSRQDCESFFSEGESSLTKGDDDPRAKDFRLAAELKNQIQSFYQAIQAKGWQSEEIQNQALQWLTAESGEIKEQGLLVLLTQPPHSESVDRVIKDVFNDHDGNLVELAMKELGRHLGRKEEERLLHQSVVQTLEKGSLLVREKLAPRVHELFNKSSIEFYKKALSRTYLDQSIRRSLEAQIKEWERSQRGA